jgi:hypothetical protein
MPTRQFGRLGGHPRARLTSPTPSFAVFLAILDILATVGDIDSPAAATRSFGGGISWEIRDGADHWCDPDQRGVPAWLIAAQASGRQTHSGFTDTSQDASTVFAANGFGPTRVINAGID